MVEQADGLATRWGGVQRRIRGLVPAPIRRADLALFRAVARSPFLDTGRVLPRLSSAANRSLIWITIAGLLAGFGGRFGRRAGFRGLLAIGVTSAVTNLPAKFLAGRTRPDLSVVPTARRLARVPASTSFPSGHSASAFAFATAVGLEQPRLRVPILVLASAVAASRVTTGVHYPGDVLAGAAIGAGVAGATRVVWPLADRHMAGGAPVADAAIDPDGAGMVVVANIDAGNALAPAASQRLLRALGEVEMLAVQEGERLPAAVDRAARRARVLAVAGGDGSIRTAAGAAMQAGIPLAIVASGTLNHLAADLGVEQVDDTIRAVREGRAIRIDVGDVAGEVFVNAASIGVYPQMVHERLRLEQRIGKWPAALFVTLRVLVRHEPIEVEIDGRSRRVWQLSLGNCVADAEGIVPTRRRQLDDGVLDARLVHAEVPWSRTRLIASVLLGRKGRCASFERWITDQVHIGSLEGPLRIACDGEMVAVGETFVVRKQRRALVVLQPSSGRARD